MGPFGTSESKLVQSMAFSLQPKIVDAVTGGIVVVVVTAVVVKAPVVVPGAAIVVVAAVGVAVGAGGLVVVVGVAVVVVGASVKLEVVEALVVGEAVVVEHFNLFKRISLWTSAPL